jgi:hypothetical protein
MELSGQLHTPPALPRYVRAKLILNFQVYGGNSRTTGTRHVQFCMEIMNMRTSCVGHCTSGVCPMFSVRRARYREVLFVRDDVLT